MGSREEALGDEASKAVQVNEVGEFEARKRRFRCRQELGYAGGTRGNFTLRSTGTGGAHFVQ